jgi:multiple RNA-binding domain-containing protein 1
VQEVLEEKLKANPKLAEFLELMKPKSASQTFANSEVAPTEPANVSLAAPAMGGLDSVRGACMPQAQGALEAQQARDIKGAKQDQEHERDCEALHDVLDDSVSDIEYLRRRMKHFEDESPSKDETASKSPNPGCNARIAGVASVREDGQEKGPDERTHIIFSSNPVEKIAQTGRLFIRNLPYVASDIDLEQLCLPFGTVTDATIVRDRATGKSKGFAVVTFAEPAHAVEAYQALDASIFQGRLLHVLPGNRPKAEESPAVDTSKPNERKRGTSSFKAEAEVRRRAEAGNRSAWSSYFLRDDTVAEAIAELTGISKAELLSPDATDAAVRLALGEAQV